MATRSSTKKVSLLEGESDLRPARKTTPTRYKPTRACLAACLTEAALRYIHMIEQLSTLFIIPSLPYVGLGASVVI